MRLRLARFLLGSELRALEARIDRQRFDRELSFRIDRVTVALEALG